MNEETNLTPKRKAFNEKYQNYSEAEIQKEILYTQKILIEKTEKVRRNTNLLVTFLVVIPLIISIIYYLIYLEQKGILRR